MNLVRMDHKLEAMSPTSQGHYFSQIMVASLYTEKARAVFAMVVLWPMILWILENNIKNQPQVEAHEPTLAYVARVDVNRSIFV